MGTGREVFYQRNQYEELFSRRLRAKHIGVSPGGQNEKIRGIVDGQRLSVSEVAERVGYINQSKFASVFKKQFGMSPLEYRRMKHLERLRLDTP